MNKFFPDSDTGVFYTFSWDRKNSSSYSGSYRRMDPGDISAGSDSLDLKRIKNRFSAVLKDNLADELCYKTTIIGPHRDDLMIVFDGKDIRYFGSQGQQRVAAICLRLFELEMLKKKLNKKPVLLLDDVLSELDEEREGVLLKVINKKFQTFITTAGRDVPDRKDTDAVEKFSIVDNMVKKVF
jgi:DNA replication and repair protein RecF